MNLFEKLAIVLEADDITKEVREEQKNLNTKPEESDSDINQTNDIFDLEDNDKQNETDPPEDNENNIDDTDDDGEQDDIDTGEDDENLDDMTSDEVEKEENPEIKQKIKLRENMILFYNIITSNIQLLQEYRPSQNTPEATNVLFNIVSNLTDCKNILYKEITESFSTKSYPLLLKTYVSISRIYDLCQKSLELYFDNIKLINSSTQKKSKKQKI